MATKIKSGEQQWPADAAERWPLSRLRDYQRNPKLHSEADVEETAASIKQWGWTIPVLVDEDGMILAGHKRVRAARKLGLMEAPVIVARGWSDEKKRAYVIADNKLGEGGRWDDTLLSIEIGAITDAGFDIHLTGLSDADLRRLSGEDGGGEALTVQQIATGPVNDVFWISIRGPMRHQADALVEMRQAMARFDGITVDLGTIAVA